MYCSRGGRVWSALAEMPNRKSNQLANSSFISRSKLARMRCFISALFRIRLSVANTPLANYPCRQLHCSFKNRESPVEKLQAKLVLCPPILLVDDVKRYDSITPARMRVHIGSIHGSESNFTTVREMDVTLSESSHRLIFCSESNIR